MPSTPLSRNRPLKGLPTYGRINIITWDGSRNQNLPTDSAEEAESLKPAGSRKPGPESGDVFQHQRLTPPHNCISTDNGQRKARSPEDSLLVSPPEDQPANDCASALARIDPPVLSKTDPGILI
jgi:hypothetical protein